MEPIKILLDEREMPRQWYNIQADLPTPMKPPLHPGTGKPMIVPEDLAPVFPMNLIEQEVSTDRWIDIPEPVLEKYCLWRPSPLCRAREFEKLLDAPVKIFYKNEGNSPPGSHKPNTAVPQAYYNKVFGIKRLSTETGAGQWGSALSMACQMFGLQCRVFMVKVSFEQKPYRRLMMMTWGAECIASPSDKTAAGRKILADFPDSPGSLGIAISEAIEDAVGDPRLAIPSGASSTTCFCTRPSSASRPTNRWKKSASIRMWSWDVPEAAVISPVSAYPSCVTKSTVKRCLLSRPNPVPARLSPAAPSLTTLAIPP